MDFPQIWPYLSTSSQAWLMEHNGERLPDDLIAEILSVTGGEQNVQWWTGSSVEERSPRGDRGKRAHAALVQARAGQARLFAA